MSFLMEQLRQLGMVVVVMICSLGGTVGMLKLIKGFLPGKKFPGDPFSQTSEESREKQSKEN